MLHTKLIGRIALALFIVAFGGVNFAAGGQCRYRQLVDQRCGDE